MARGRIKTWKPDKGFGFITNQAGGKDVFFHVSELRGLTSAEVSAGVEVEFNLEQGQKGPQARQVRRWGDTPPATPAPRALSAASPGPGPRSPGGEVSLPATEVPLPRSTQELIERVPLAQRHPGLQLDRYVIPGDQQSQHATLVAVTRVQGDRQLFAEVRARRADWLQAAQCWQRRTVAPLTLHLSRASALENAGLCLHRIYGFPYLPGSSLKGMARAFATSVVQASAAEIRAVFGNETGDKEQSAGAIVFHDAWPADWPNLLVDIVNNHHPTYYQGEAPPGDWDDPTPVYFLAIPPGTTFEFALASRRPAEDEGRWLALARDWLDGALTCLGAGAKTAAGYGSFQEEGPAPSYATREQLAITLELVSPAFLAGASQDASDCNLRSATLRGMLRWWWRSFHVGFVDVDTLRRMEAAVWGDTEAGGALRLTVARVPGGPEPQACPFKRMIKNQRGQDVLRYDQHGFGRDHGIEADAYNRTQGLVYSSYGMDEMDAGKPQTRKQRWYCPAGSRWEVRFSARLSHFAGRELPAALVLQQAKLALWWLCALGGVGGKGRKGFGSFADIDFQDLEGKKWRSAGREFRKACGLPEDEFRAEWAASPALKRMRELSDAALGGAWLEVQTPWSDPWRVLDEIGKAMQAFAQAEPRSRHGKHCPGKRHLGLPRSIDKSPRKRELVSARGKRHASPALYHVARGANGLKIRVCAFPTADTRAPDEEVAAGFQESERILGQLLQHLRNHLDDRVLHT
jgi:CRISPR-associated protein Cmr6